MYMRIAALSEKFTAALFFFPFCLFDFGGVFCAGMKLVQNTTCLPRVPSQMGGRTRLVKSIKKRLYQKIKKNHMDDDGASGSELQPWREETEEQTYRQNNATVTMEIKQNAAGMTGAKRRGDARECVRRG